MRRVPSLATATAGLSVLLVLLTAAPSGAGSGDDDGSDGRNGSTSAGGSRSGIGIGIGSDPVVVDPSGRAGHCPVGRRGRDPHHRTGGPWTAPTRGYWLSAGYAAKGERWARRHTGQDFAVPTGTPVYAVGPGTVEATTCGDGFGNQVVVRHPGGHFTQYAHLSRIDVRRGDRVFPGTRLGLSGATGNVTGPHLHFEVRMTPYIGSAVAPLPWLRGKDVRLGR
ncbi:M23 family metallopeptidase [Streptomyces sp. T028]|uniref:M23 family metallopeptidase n=1 Tax=Streptomyces sp. T028 TaxID=3394379 RepID=UPI003A84E485